MGGKPRRSQLVVSPGAFPPAVQVTLFTDKEWEAFIEECCLLDGGGTTYAQVKRFGGPGDAGRDVEARLTPQLAAGQWDLYQAKHYKNPVTPGDFFPELLKFFRHLLKETYPAPRYYFLCSPRNSGPDLHDLLAAPPKLKTRFIEDLKAGNTGLKLPIGKRGATLLAFVEAYDFTTIREYLLRNLLKLHKTDAVRHFKTFHIKPERGDDPDTPQIPGGDTEVDEQVYVNQLLRVYGEISGGDLTLDEVMAHLEYSEHFHDCRNDFFCAEGLRRFSRDLLPGEFERLLDMVHAGVRATTSSPKHQTGLDRLTATTDRAAVLQITDSPLHSNLRGGDLPGTCHHLVNEGRLKWLK